MSWGSLPDAVDFTSMECCAMRRASKQEMHQPMINDYLMQIAPTYRHRTSILLEIFIETTIRFSFSPEMEHLQLYKMLAAAEKVALEKLEHGTLECGHLASEHQRALDAVLTKMQAKLVYN